MQRYPWDEECVEEGLVVDDDLGACWQTRASRDDKESSTNTARHRWHGQSCDRGSHHGKHPIIQ